MSPSQITRVAGWRFCADVGLAIKIPVAKAVKMIDGFFIFSSDDDYMIIG